MVTLGNKPITWTKVDPYQFRDMASVGHNVLTMSTLLWALYFADDQGPLSQT